MSMIIKNKIKEFQRQLGLNADGKWGGVSQETLENSNMRIEFKPEFVNRLLNGVNTKISKDLRKQSIDSILNACNDMLFKGTKFAKNPLYIGYIFATAYHETAYTLYPISEYGKGLTRPYGKVFKNSKGLRYGIKNSKGHAYDYEKFPFTYYGRGLVQLTWFDNYELMSKLCGIDLLTNPSEANNPKYASLILVYGMINGSFTGRKLSSYIKYGLDADEFVNARRIINSTDKASKIAEHAYEFIDNMILVDTVKEEPCTFICPCGKPCNR